MTLTPGEIQRKVRQLDNDMQAVYEMYADIAAQQRRQATLLGALDAKVDGLETKVDGLETKVDGLGTKVDGLGTKVDGLGVALAELTDLVRGGG